MNISTFGLSIVFLEAKEIQLGGIDRKQIYTYAFNRHETIPEKLRSKRG